MQLISSPEETRGLSLKWHRKGESIAFVPTMGALHEGHLSLLREGRRLGDKLVLSIYVNPTQFAPTEDLAKYPRDKDGDLKKAESCGVDVVFFPSDEVMYPEGFQTYVEVTKVTKGLCGEKRPAHFKGVTTVVAKLFNIVCPDKAIFGEKDFQQLVTIKRMVRDLNMPIEIVGRPIYREADGLAMSSRNVYLSAEERKAAIALSRSLKVAQGMVKSGEKSADKIISEVKRGIEAERHTKIDYVKFCDPETLEELKNVTGPVRFLLAAFVGKTRLIDNCEIVYKG